MLAAGDGMTLQGFGRFELKKRDERTAFSPGEGRKIIIPPHSVPAFKFAKAIRDACRNVNA